MLIEISCDQFLDNGCPRGPIKLNKGLNAVVGSLGAHNSIGKTTFLYIVDFCFGGRDYVKKDSDIRTNVGDHSIKFIHEFNGARHYFVRSTKSPNVVAKCNSKFETVEEMSLDDFNDWLRHQYQMDELGSTFRNLVGCFVRLSRKDNHEAEFPLKSVAADRMKNGIERLISLYGYHGELSQLNMDLNAAEQERSEFNSRSRFNSYNPAPNKKEYEKNVEEIQKLMQRKAELAEQSCKGLTDQDAVVAEEIASLQKALSSLRRQRAQLKSQLSKVEDDEYFTSRRSRKNIESLAEFFPNVDMRKFDDIESFHVKLSTILKREREEQAEEISEQIEGLEERIQILESRLSELKNTTDFSLLILETYSHLNSQIKELSESNRLYDLKSEIENNYREKKRLRDERQEHMLGAIQTELNESIRDLNRNVCGPEKNAPVLLIQGAEKYKYSIANDKGTGSLDRALILFDLAVLRQTPLPIVIHDSIVNKHIEYGVMAKIIEEYGRSDKQVFIAVDGANIDPSKDILKKATVLSLGPGHELFGRAWNEGSDDKNQYAEY